MADLSVKTYESFFSFLGAQESENIDNINARAITISSDRSFCQIFKAQSNELETFFFLSDVRTTNTAFNVEVYSVTSTGSGSSEVFELGSRLNNTAYPASVFQQLDRNPILTGWTDTTGPFWYSINASFSLTEGSHYAIVFSNSGDDVNIYHTEYYRNDVFRQVQVSDDYAVGLVGTWSNGLYTEGISTYSEGKMGSLCLGFLGNEIDSEHPFKTGDVVFGGSDSRRGYPVYLFVKRTGTPVKVRFTTESPVGGDSLEANRSDMSWYWYQEGVLPVVNVSSVLNKISNQPRLNFSTNFVLFTQPEKFSAYPKIYFPESDMALEDGTLSAITLYEDDEDIQKNENVIYNTSNDYSNDNWAHFTKQADTGQNPSFLDIVVQNQEGLDFEEVSNIDVSSYSNIIGFGPVIEYKGKLIAFSRNNVSDIIYCVVGENKNGSFLWSAPQSLGLSGTGVSDAIVVKDRVLLSMLGTGTFETKVYAFSFTFSDLIITHASYFLSLSDYDANDTDGKFIKFVDSDWVLYSTINSTTKFGLWKINVSTEGSVGDPFVASFVTRGFGENSNTQEREISATCVHNGLLYLGVSTGTIFYQGFIYSLDKNFNYNQVLASPCSYPLSAFPWMASLSGVVSGYDVESVCNTRVVYMVVVDNFLHFWISSDFASASSLNGRPMHICYNTLTKEFKLLRMHPIGSTYTEKDMHTFTSGCMHGNYIVIGGNFGMNDPLGFRARTMMYDTRTINNAWNFSENSSHTGYYDRDTITEYSYFYDDYKDYPGLHVTSETPRKGIYCGGVCSVLPSAQYTIEGNLNDVNPIVFAQNGVFYMLCKNTTYGHHLYKTYCKKQDVLEWGAVETINSLDPSSYYTCYKGSSELINKGKEDFVYSNVNGEAFISLIGSGETNRYIYRTTSGVNNVQDISFYYKLNYHGAIQEAASLVDIDTANTSLVIKYANTWEDLFYDPMGKITIPLAYEITEQDTRDKKNLFRHVFKTDLKCPFFRIESPTIYDAKTSIKVKALRFSDVDTLPNNYETNTKKVSAIGITNSENSPEQIINSEVVLGPEDEIIIDFANRIYLSQFSFEARSLGDGQGARFSFYYLPNFNETLLSNGVVTDKDWVECGFYDYSDPSVSESTFPYSLIESAVIRKTVSAIKIKLFSNVDFTIKNFVSQTFGSSSSTPFSVTGGIGNAELIVVDDIDGLLGKKSLTEEISYSTFRKEGDSLVIDVRNGTSAIYIDRITMCVNDGCSRNIKVDVSTDNVNWTNLSDECIQDYTCSYVNWVPRTKSESDRIIVSLYPDSDLSNIDVHQTIVENNNIDFSTGMLRDYVFRPDVSKPRNLTIVDNELYEKTVNTDPDGYLMLNAQMDQDGQFRGDVGKVGAIEKLFNVEFPITQVKYIRITVYGFDGLEYEKPVKINGFKIYTPLIDSNGVAKNPSLALEWNIGLKTSAISSSSSNGLASRYAINPGGGVAYSGFGWSGYSGYSGARGPSGSDSGYSGQSGYSGTNGQSGYSGQRGPGGGESGYSGYSGLGISGYSGFSGFGLSGFSGFSGYSGLSNISGYSGYSGKSGYSGSGVSGYSGYSGAGTSGYSGYSGQRGAPGVGIQGDPGESGSPTKGFSFSLFNYDVNVVTGDSVAFFTVPSTMAGSNLSNVTASVYTVSSSAATTIQVYKRSRDGSQGVTMLSSSLSIAQNAFYGLTSSVKSDGSQTVSEGDIIYISVVSVSSSNPPKGLTVSAIFV